MPVTLNFHVAQGNYAIVAPANIPLGTSGLATCVGIIMQLTNGDYLCGHMDHAMMATRATATAFTAAVTTRLNAATPAANVAALHFATPGGTLEAQYTVAAIMAWFPAAINAGTGMCIYVNASGVVQSTNDTIISLPSGTVSTGPFTV